MIDDLNPTNQFHPYRRPEELIPPTPAPSAAEKARAFARNNPGLVAGGLAAIVIGVGMMRRR